ncbi:MAG: T9SS type A sorting domain-containing protein [Bacteroidetes bacterium]|nr:T9SS type A sorting domain-containing protein [Bacteroidota bacterium]
MKTYLYFVSVLFCFLLQSVHVDASSPMGGEMTYVNKGNSKYTIYVRVYRDCNGIALSQSNVIGKCSSNTITISNQTKLSTRDVTGMGTNCSVQSKCAGGSFVYGIEEVTWSMDVDLSGYSCCEWNFSWSLSTRSGSISTGLAGQDFYISTMLNKCLSSSNSSPVFTSEPQILLCYNQDQVINLGAIDTIDTGDSLSFHLAEALVGSNTTFPNPIWTKDRPISFLGFPNNNLGIPAGFHLNPVTGDLSFRPTLLSQVGVVVVEVKEWRTINGTPTVIGVTRRDWELIVINCPNNRLPTMSPPYSSNFCVGKKSCLSINTNDLDSSDTTSIYCTSLAPGASFTDNNGTTNHASGQICWTPDSTMVRNQPYLFIVTVKDNACPLNGKVVRAINIFVRDQPKGILHDTVLSCGNLALDYTITHSVDGLNAWYSILDSARKQVWAGNTKQDTAKLSPGRHYVQLHLSTLTACEVIYEDTISIAPYIQVKLPMDTALCYSDSLHIQGLVYGGTSPYQLEWYDLANRSSLGISANSYSYSVVQDDSLLLIATDATGCSNRDSIVVKMNPLPFLHLGKDTAVCEGEMAVIDAGGDSLNWTYQWSTGDTTQKIITLAIQNLNVAVKDSLGCNQWDTINVVENKIRVTGLSNQQVCSGDSIHFSLSGADQYDWFDESTYSGNGQDTPIYTGVNLDLRLNKNLLLIVNETKTISGVSCHALDTVNLNTWALPTVNLGGDQRICHGDSVMLISFGGTGSSYQWNTGSMDPSIWIKDSGDYKVKVVDLHQCSNSDSMHLDVMFVPIQACNDQSSCPYDTVFLSVAGAVDSFRWYDATTFVRGINNQVLVRGDSFRFLTGTGFTWLAEGIKTDKGLTCRGYDTVNINDFPLTPLQVIYGDSVGIDSVNSYIYSVAPSGQAQVNWSVINGTILSGQRSATVEVKWTHPGGGSITAQGVSPDGCISEVTLNVMIVPTGFELPMKGSFRIYPNPGKDWFTLELSSGIQEAGYQILNALGQQVAHGKLIDQKTGINLSFLPEGTYLVRVQSDQNVFIQRLVISGR